MNINKKSDEMNNIDTMHLIPLKYFIRENACFAQKLTVWHTIH